MLKNRRILKVSVFGRLFSKELYKSHNCSVFFFKNAKLRVKSEKKQLKTSFKEKNVEIEKINNLKKKNLKRLIFR